MITTDETEPGTFVCSECQRETPNSEGAADDMPEACDDCWFKAHDGEDVADGPVTP